MSYVKSNGQNIFYELFERKSDYIVMYVAGHREIAHEKYKPNKIRDFCLKNDISFCWYDYMGYGKSEGIKDVWQVSEWLQNIVDVMDALPNKKLILVGNSMGGYLMLGAGLLKSEKIAGMFGFVPGFGKSFNDNPTKFIADFQGKIKIDILNDQGFNYINQPLDIKCPVSLLYSYDDESVDIRSASLMLKSVKQAQIMKVRGISHKMEDDNCIDLATFFIKAIAK